MKPAKETHPTSPSLLRDRAFLLFNGGQAVSGLGDAITQTALPLLVLQLTGSGTQMGVVAMLHALPMLLFGFPAGVLADRWDRRRTMMMCDVGRAILVGCIPLSVVLGLPTMWVLYVVVVPIGTLYVLFDAICYSCLPALVGRKRLAQANAYLSMTKSVGYVAGPGMAGFLTAAMGAAYTLSIDAATFAISALSLALIRRPFQGERAPASITMAEGMKEGFTFIYRHRMLRTVITYWALVSFMVAPIVVAATFYITKDLAMSERALGSVISSYAIGSVSGALAGTRIPHARAGYALLGGITAGGLALIALASVDVLWMALVVAFVAGAGESMAVVFYATMRASVTPDHLLGRVISTARVVTFGLQPLSMFIGGLLLDAVGGAVTLWIMGGASLATSAIFWTVPGLRSTLTDSTHLAGPPAADERR
jgi:MFS transporter, ENTS family, enterobactin (siderophore) exporter